MSRGDNSFKQMEFTDSGICKNALSDDIVVSDPGDMFNAAFDIDCKELDDSMVVQKRAQGLVSRIVGKLKPKPPAIKPPTPANPVTRNMETAYAPIKPKKGQTPHQRTELRQQKRANQERIQREKAEILEAQRQRAKQLRESATDQKVVEGMAPKPEAKMGPRTKKALIAAGLLGTGTAGGLLASGAVHRKLSQ